MRFTSLQFSKRRFFVILEHMRQSAFHFFFARTITGWMLLICSPGVWAMPLSEKAVESSTVQSGPPGSWVQPHIFDQQAAATVTEAGTDQYLLLFERQINAVENETFVHSVRQLLTVDGVQNDSTLTIDFNPAYQSLTWHWARIWRGGEHIERLDTNEVKIVQKEKDLDQFLLNGEKSAVLVLDDVRPGDIVDYAYSIKGLNPVFGGHFSAEVPVQVGEPAARLLTRVVWPKGGRLYAKAHGCSVEPTVVVAKDTIEYTWDVRQVPAAAREDFLPSWFDPEGWVQLSGFKTWGEVNQWALPLFQATAPFAPGLSQKIMEWKGISSPEEQIVAVLRFVQDEVRYFGIEMGAGTVRPANPSTVFARRFGDCKDKSFLFVTILRALGIEACPVLVNSTMGRALDDWQPSARAFDHCIAVVQCEGRTYWVDPTMNYQRGLLAAHFLPAYERGLVISPGTTGLTVIPQATGLPQTTTTEYFQLADRTEAAGLRVVTVAEGRDADSLRELFATTQLADIEKSDTHYYADSYPGIKMASPLVVEDDEQQDRFQTTEFYTIDKAWSFSDKDRKYRCEFYPAAMGALLKTPVDTERTLPLGMNFPEHVILRTEVTLPGEGWPTEGDKKEIDDPAFVFQKESRCAGGKLVMQYEYQSLADSVYPEAMARYLERLNQSSQALGYTLIWRSGRSGTGD
jgi:arylamine N-acetyltransferase